MPAIRHTNATAVGDNIFTNARYKKALSTVTPDRAHGLELFVRAEARLWSRHDCLRPRLTALIPLDRLAKAFFYRNRRRKADQPAGLGNIGL